jgi:hypothetical protein
METGMPNPFPIGGLWCDICKKQVNDPYHCQIMQKYYIVPKNSYCNFCKSVGHDDKDCRTMDLVRERTSDAYMVQEEMMIGKAAPWLTKYQPRITLCNNSITLRNNNITLHSCSAIPHSHTIIPRSITKCLNIMYHEEIKLATEVEEEK